MQGTAATHTSWFDRPHLTPRRINSAAHITLIAISVITLLLAFFLTLVSSGVLWQTIPLYSLTEVMLFGSVAFLTLATASSIISLALLPKNFFSEK